MNTIIAMEERYGARHYHPIPVVLTRGEGVYVWDTAGTRYIDMMSAYSAVSHGHCHPRLVRVLKKQAETLAIVSRAFHSDALALFLKRLCEATGFPKALPMNSGAEAVETAIKAARKWAYTVKGVAKDKAEIIVCEGNFHGRTTTIVGFSSEEQYRSGFGPFSEGFKRIPYNDADALEWAITPRTAAFIVEPIQGEGGILIPDKGYLARCKAICAKHNVLMICDEIQTGMGRTGKFLCYEHEGIQPDGVIMGKALGGGLLAVSAFLSRQDVMNVFTPGDHGSTFGGNQLASVVGKEALDVLFEEGLIERSATLGHYLLESIRQLNSPLIKNVRGRGLFIGIEIDPAKMSAREVCLQLMKEGILSKETHETVVRLAPPLVITQAQLDEVIAALKKVLC